MFALQFRTDFVLTASCDGHLKFWRKTEEAGIEFVKHFRCHLGMDAYSLLYRYIGFYKKVRNEVVRIKKQRRRNQLKAR